MCPCVCVSDNSFKKTLCLINNCRQDLLLSSSFFPPEPTLWFRLWFVNRTIFLEPVLGHKIFGKCRLISKFTTSWLHISCNINMRWARPFSFEYTHLHRSAFALTHLHDALTHLHDARRLSSRKGSGVGDGSSSGARVTITRIFKAGQKLTFTCSKFPYILMSSTERFPLPYECNTSPWLPVSRILLVFRDTFSHLHSHVVPRTISRILSRSVQRNILHELKITTWYKSRHTAFPPGLFLTCPHFGWAKKIFSNFDETQSKEAKRKNNESKKKTHRGQNVRYRSWWKQGNIKMAVSEDHASCWIHKDLTVTTKKNWALLTAARASSAVKQTVSECLAPN